MAGMARPTQQGSSMPTQAWGMAPEALFGDL